MQYLARFRLENGEVCQGLVHFPAEPRIAIWYPDRWFTTTERLARAYSAIPGCELSIRASLRSGRLDQTLLFHAPIDAGRGTPALPRLLLGTVRGC